MQASGTHIPVANVYTNRDSTKYANDKMQSYNTTAWSTQLFYVTVVSMWLFLRFSFQCGRFAIISGFAISDPEE